MKFIKRHSALLLILLIVGLYFTANLRFSGPAIIGDEVGYLTKASALAGFPVDNANSWHGGYALLISPLFGLFEETSAIWIGIIFINAITLFIGLFFASKIINKLLGAQNKRRQLTALIFVASYPAWIALLGYSLTSLLFSMLFTLLIWTYISLSDKSYKKFALLGLLTGVMYFVHPIGVAITLSVGLTLLLGSRRNNISKQAIFWVVAIFLTLFYHIYLHEAINLLLESDVYPAGAHYQDLSFSIAKVLNIDFIQRFIAMFVGGIAYVTIASYGFSSMVLIDSYAVLRKKLLQKKSLSRKDFLPLLLLFSLISISLVAALVFNFARLNTFRDDMWVYGRYLDMIILPILAYGVVRLGFKKSLLISLAIVLVSLGSLSIFVDIQNTAGGTNYINLVGFWPIGLYESANFFAWMIIAVVAIVAVYKFREYYFLLLTIPLGISMMLFNIRYHESIVDDPRLTKPTALVEALTSEDADDVVCIGYQPNLPRDLVKRIRILSYKFYFYDLNMQRMTIDEWSTSDCNYYMTFDNSLKPTVDASIVAREEVSALYLIKKDGASQSKFVEGIDSDKFVYFDRADMPGMNSCAARGCFKRTMQDLKDFIETENLQNGALQIDGDESVVVSGPFAGLESGDYGLEVRGSFEAIEGMRIYVVDGQSEQTPQEIIVTEEFRRDDNTLLVPFSLAMNVSMLDIQIHSTGDTKATIYEYEIVSR